MKNINIFLIILTIFIICLSCEKYNYDKDLKSEIYEIPEIRDPWVITPVDSIREYKIYYHQYNNDTRVHSKYH